VTSRGLNFFKSFKKCCHALLITIDLNSPTLVDELKTKHDARSGSYRTNGSKNGSKNGLTVGGGVSGTGASGVIGTTGSGTCGSCEKS
jgi:hypothetical protein